MVSTIRLYAINAYNKYRLNKVQRLNEFLKAEHRRRENRTLQNISERMKHETECKCEKCCNLDLVIKSIMTIKILTMEQFLESNKYCKIFNTVVQKDEMMHGQNLRKMPPLEEINHL